MDESFIEAAEAAQLAMLANSIAQRTNRAFSSQNLCLHEIKMYECNECGEDLPLFRMYKGLICCTACQSNIDLARNPLGRSV